jgi:hypothetical protein
VRRTLIAIASVSLLIPVVAVGGAGVTGAAAASCESDTPET